MSGVRQQPMQSNLHCTAAADGVRSVTMGCVDSAEHSAGAARSAVETQATAQLLMACVAARVPHAHAMYGVAVVLSAMGGDRAEQRTS